MEERWLPVPGFEGAYEVSDQGRLKSLSRLLRSGRTCRERIINGSLNGAGRRVVTLNQDCRKRCCFIYQLVVEAFLGSRPEGYVVHHRDGNPTNDCLENLEYTTFRQNKVYDSETGRAAHGERHGRSRFTTDQVLELRSLWETGEWKQRDLAKKYGVTQRAVWQVIHRHTWKHV